MTLPDRIRALKSCGLLKLFATIWANLSELPEAYHVRRIIRQSAAHRIPVICQNIETPLILLALTLRRPTKS